MENVKVKNDRKSKQNKSNEHDIENGRSWRIRNTIHNCLVSKEHYDKNDCQYSENDKGNNLVYVNIII
jgi:hypothetical protein